MYSPADVKVTEGTVKNYIESPCYHCRKSYIFGQGNFLLLFCTRGLEIPGRDDFLSSSGFSCSQNVLRWSRYFRASLAAALTSARPVSRTRSTRNSWSACSSPSAGSDELRPRNCLRNRFRPRSILGFGGERRPRGVFFALVFSPGILRPSFLAI